MAGNYENFHIKGDTKKLWRLIPTVSISGGEIYPDTSASVLIKDSLGDNFIRWEMSVFKYRNVISKYLKQEEPRVATVLHTYT